MVQQGHEPSNINMKILCINTYTHINSWLQLFESPCHSWGGNGGRFLWQYGVDYSPRIKGFTETIRLFKIVRDHDNVSREMGKITDSLRQGRQSVIKRKLRYLF